MYDLKTARGIMIGTFIGAIIWFAAVILLSGCATQNDLVDYDYKIVVPDLTRYQAYTVTIIRTPYSTTIYNSRPIFLPYSQIPVAPPPTTVYIY